MENTVKTGDIVDSNSTAPIERVPDDVLLQIFALSASHASDLSYSDTFLHKASLTCRTWHRLSLSPTLWAKFTLTLDEEAKASPAVIASKVLERTEQSPLSIRCIITNYNIPSILVPRCTAAISLLLEQSHRWKTFICSVSTSKFDAQYSPVLMVFPSAAGASYPLLEHLELIGCQVPSYHFEAFTNSFQSAPRLQAFHFQVASPSIHAPTIHSLQWNNHLVHYTCSYHDRDVLRRCVNLKTYVINCRATRSDQAYCRPEAQVIPNTSIPSILLPHLMEISTDDPNTLLGCILPSLVDLSCFIEPPDESYDDFLCSVSQCQALLKHFFIAWGRSPSDHHYAHSEDDFSAFLSALHETCGSSLEILSIRLRGQRGLDQLCMVLTSFAGALGSLPNLRELRIWVATNSLKHGQGKEWEHLIPNVITSRNSNLRVLDVTFTPQGKPKNFTADKLSKLVSRDTVEKLALLATQRDVNVTVQSKHNGSRWSCI